MNRCLQLLPKESNGLQVLPADTWRWSAPWISPSGPSPPLFRDGWATADEEGQCQCVKLTMRSPLAGETLPSTFVAYDGLSMASSPMKKSRSSTPFIILRWAWSPTLADSLIAIPGDDERIHEDVILKTDRHLNKDVLLTPWAMKQLAFLFFSEKPWKLINNVAEHNVAELQIIKEDSSFCNYCNTIYEAMRLTM